MASLLAEMVNDAGAASPASEGLQLNPSEPPLKLGVGEALIVSALAEACGTPVAELNDELQSTGDLGLLAQARIAQAAGSSSSAGAAVAPPLTLADMRVELLALSEETGKGSVGRKSARLAEG